MPELPNVSDVIKERYGAAFASTDLDEIENTVGILIVAELERRPLTPMEALAVRAIKELSRAGMDLMHDATRANSRDVERLSTRARAHLDAARALMLEFAAMRDVA